MDLPDVTGPGPGAERAPAGRARSKPSRTDAEVVVMAASAGGLPVLRQILSGLPADFPLPIVIVQHRSMVVPSLAAQILSRAGPLPVKEAEQGEVLEPGTVYLTPPDRHLVLRPDLRVRLMDGHRIRFVLSSATPLFASAAFALEGRVIGVALSGGGSDGTDGVESIRGMGGIVIAQDPSTAQQTGMPASAIRTGAPDHVVAASQIAPLLVRLVRGGAPRRGPRGGSARRGARSTFHHLTRGRD